MEHRVFGLDDPAAIDQALAGVDVALNCAGPFVHTFEPLVAGCLRTGTHYLDITGEIPVYEGLAARDAEARARGITLLPGPEGGVEWTSRTALGAAEKVLSGNAPAGFQTPSTAYGAGFVMECEGVTRQDVH